MTTFEKLAVRIKKDLDINLINFQRRRVGYWQRSAGAWLWIATRKHEDGSLSASDYGSCYSATDLLREKKPLVLLESNKYEIHPDS